MAAVKGCDWDRLPRTPSMAVVYYQLEFMDMARATYDADLAGGWKSVRREPTSRMVADASKVIEMGGTVWDALRVAHDAAGMEG